MRQVHPYGNPQAPYLVVLGKPNKLEAERRRAGVGTQFQLIVHALELVGINKSDCLFVNAVSAKKQTDWKPSDVKEDAAQYLWSLLSGRRMVIACGSTAACALNLSEGFDGVSKLYGTSTMLNMGTFQVPVVLTLDPFLIAQNPRKLTEVRHNLFFGIQAAQGTKFEFPKFSVNPLDTVADIEAMAHKVFTAEDFYQKFVAYDHEATLLNQRKSKIVTTAFCNGEWSVDRGFETYLWAPYDSLVPRYSPEHQQRMEKALVEFSYALREKARRGEGGRVGHHRIYDDYVEYMNYLKFMNKGVHWSQWDTKIMFWGYDSLTNNGLKDLFFTFFGVPDYDKVITDEVSKVTQRRARSRYLFDPADFRALEWAGVAPEEITLPKTGEVKYKWPEKSPTLGSKDYAYAVLPLELLGPYNCQDVVATWLSFRELYQIHERQGTLKAQLEKHKGAIRLHEATMHGMPTDIGMNREFSHKLTVIEEETTALILKTLETLGYSPEVEGKIFNPGSDTEVRKILYGNPVEVPVLDPTKHAEQMVEQFGSVKRAATKIDEAFSGMWTTPEFKKAVSSGAIDADVVLRESIRLCQEKLGVHEPVFKKTKIYPGALCQPRAFTKTGLPSVSRVILETHVNNDEESDAKEFILALLLRAKVKKIRSTFVDSIYHKLESPYTVQGRPHAFCHPYYNEVGTISGRSSSSSPNGQNYPPKVRGQHVPLPGHYFLEFDFKQAEIRVAAAMSNDKALIAALTSGQDLHTQTAMMMFGISDPKDVSKEQRKGAKAQPDYALIPTPFGMRTMGSLKSGDFVFGKDGRPVRVKDRFPRGEKTIYEVSFCDGQVVECAGDHLWTVVDTYAQPPKKRTATTLELMEEGTVFGLRDNPRYRVEAVDAAVEFLATPEQLPIGPYTLGVLLGDGSIQHSNFTVKDPEIADKVREEAKQYGWELEDRTGEKRISVYWLRSTLKRRRSIHSEFRRIDDTVRWVSNDKYIPPIYLRASKEDRLNLLRGLMDTDGTASKSHNYNYCSVSERLVKDVAQLVRSLGGRARICKNETRKTMTAGKYSYPPGRVYYRVQIQMPECPFYLPRKVERWVPRRKNWLRIEAIKKTDRKVSMSCIEVDAQDHLYLTEGYIPTHNSINFGVIYGMSSVRLALMLGISVEEADVLINDRYFGIYPELKAWIDEMHRIAKLPPYYVTTPMGTRISTLDTLSISQDVRSHAERQAVNAPVQGGAGEYAFWMIDELCSRIERNGWLTAENATGFFSTVHDSAGIMQLAQRNLAWIEGLDAEGKQIVKGPMVEEIESILAMPAPWHPLERVPMGVDLEINYNWSGKPDIMRAIDPNYGRKGQEKDNQHLAWDLIDLTRLTEDERKEIEEITTVGSYAR